MRLTDKLLQVHAMAKQDLVFTSAEFARFNWVHMSINPDMKDAISQYTFPEYTSGREVPQDSGSRAPMCHRILSLAIIAYKAKVVSL